jgi:predicted lipoprotein with Yx(FWY)xxD motif
MVNYRSLSAIFVAIAIILAASTGYLVAFPPSGHATTVTHTETTTAAGGPYTVNLDYKAGVGFYLANASGYTLYFRATDPGNGSSTCTGGCVAIWPLFYAGSGTISVPPGLSASSFGTATRSDGQKQTTYNGYPLYYYVNDKSAGQVTGEGKGNFYACCSIISSSTSSSSSTSLSSSSYSVEIGSSTSIGNYLENRSGFTLYMFAQDTPGNGTSACTGSCAAVWPPFYANGSLTLPSGLNSSSFSTITRADGSKQTTYNGWPLYYYAPDSSGKMFGEGADQFGGLWYAVPPTMQQSGGQIISGSSYNVGIAYKPSIGIYLTNSSGFTLYYRSTDKPNSGNTTCTTDTCEANWPVFYQTSMNLAPGLSSSQFSSITAYNSTKIVTYNGYPLFYWAHDSKPGDTTGQGIGGFYVATLPFTAVTTSSTTTTS